MTTTFSGNLISVDSWAMVYTDGHGCIQSINEKAKCYFSEPLIGQEIHKVFPWFREEWFYGNAKSRVVKTSQYDKVLMEIIPDQQQNGYFYLLFKNVDEYRNLTHLWCEVEDSLIRLQPFIDNSHDGIIITNGIGIVRAINHAFTKVSGLTEDDVLGKSVYDLCKQDLLPEGSMMHAIERRKMESSVVNFPAGKRLLSRVNLCVINKVI